MDDLNIELKECPCCGHKQVMLEELAEDQMFKYRIICYMCLVHIEEDDKEKMVAAWNNRARITELEADNKALRTLLFLRHGCGFEALYGDDGELQCHKCGIDFKRMSAEEISARFEAIGRASCAERDADIARLEAEINRLNKRTSGSIRVGGFGCPIVDDEET